MSQTVTIDGHAEPAARTEGGQQQGAGPAVAIEESPQVSASSDADAIRESREALARITAERDSARGTARAAQTDAARLRDENARIAAGRANDQRAMLTEAITGADAALAQAKAAFRAAHDVGDADAMANAQEAIGSATYRKSQASGELARLGDAPAGGDQASRQGGGQQQTRQEPVWTPGPRARQWLAEHPRMSDPEYAATAALADRQARARGLMAETDGYMDHINRVMNAAYGEGHAGGASNGGQNMQNGGNQGGGNGGNGSAGPSNRGGGQQQGGWKPVRTGLGVVNVADQNGRMRISFPDPSVRENMEEGAKVCFPDDWSKDPAAALAKYTGEQVKIAREIEAGGIADLRHGEGRDYR